MKNVTMKEIKESGVTFGQFLGFDIYGRLEADEVVLTANVMLEENSDASVHVAEVSCETMKEAKETLKEELRNIEHNANDIKTLAIENDFVGTYDDLIELLSNEEENTDTKLRLCESPELTEEQMAMIERQTAFDNVTESRARELFELGTPITIRESYGDFGLEYSPREYNDFEQVIELLDSPTTAYFMVEPEAHQKAKQLEQRNADEQDYIDIPPTPEELKQLDQVVETLKQENQATETLPEAIQSAINEIEAMSTTEARLNAYKSFYIETHQKLIEATTPKRRSRVSNLAVVSNEIKSTASAQRGEEARQQIEKDAMKYMGMANITFDRRGKYKDWYISATDEHGEEMCQRLDAFKKTLQKVIEVAKES
ncbi:hypothetical protein V9652_000375 [Vibrio alginolyticus]|nr:hypothetical protein [Vibrio parahaemolyticus]